MIKPVNGAYHFVCDVCARICKHDQGDLIVYWWQPRNGKITDDVYMLGDHVYCAYCYNHSEGGELNAETVCRL